jgi:hypothetical protein
MGHWDVRSYENDDAAEALDAGFDRVHGAAYEALMDDRNPLPFEAVQKQLASPETLAAAIDALREAVGRRYEAWDDAARLAFAGVVVQHAEWGVVFPDDLRARALNWLEHEEINWEETTLRARRRRQEITLLGPPTR